VGLIIASIIFYKKYRKRLLQGKIVREKPMLKEYIKYALWCFLGLNIATLFGQIIQQIIIVMIGPEAAGYYTNFLSLFGIAAVIV
jgi:O-antigen/teichoic acid export membrane protein